MKQLIIGIMAISAITFTACNSNESKSGKDNMSEMKTDTSKQDSTPDLKDVKEISPAFASVDATVAGYIKNIVDHYLHIKNALANDNGGEAADGAKTMERAIGKLDKSLLTAGQKNVYDEIEEDLKEHAEHIGKNGDNIKHQREHFSMMSEDVYDLAKTFGGGRTLYHDHCPMYNEKKGAMWLSEIKEVKNPYFGAEMPTCGTIEEVIK